MSTVAIVRCDSYVEEVVKKAVTEVLELLGGVEKLIQPSHQIFIKPNLAGPYPPDRQVTTHPSVVKALTQQLQSFGARITIGDSPSGLHNPAYLRMLYRMTGMEKVAHETGAVLNYNIASREVSYPEGKQLRRLTLLSPLLDSESIVTVPKLKTHLFTKITGAVKVLYGAVPGVMKIAYHSRFQDPLQFSQMLVDIYRYLNPRFTLVDGVVGMEGNGPAWGQPRKLGLIIAGEDSLAVDWVISRIINLDPFDVPVFGSDGIPIPRIVGMDLEEARVTDFRLPAPTRVSDGLIAIRWVPKSLRDRLGYHLLSKPFIDESKCTGCSTCAKSCPQQTIEIIKGKARIDHGNCIRCWCCNEVCPQGAVILKQSLLGRLSTRLQG
ncbi:MAG TPA: DUF362 domain-containing protein [Candidatus Latescibacteria bacterium]|nr:DUF362 domain-containing protein [Candidatus Latescibacterota bacterium]